MMNCEESLILISAAADGEVTPGERAALEEHLHTCPPCAALAEDFGAMSAALAEEVSCPAGLTEEITAALDKADAAAAGNPSLWKRYGSLAAMLAVVILAGGVFAVGGGTKFAASPRAADSATGGADAQGGTAAYAYTTEENALTAPDIALTEPNPAVAIENESELARQGARTVFAHLGGEAAYPNAVWESDGRSCLLESRTEEGKSIQLWLIYTGGSANGKYLTYLLREEGYDTAPNGMAWATFVERYALSLDGETLLTGRDADYDNSLLP